MQLFPKWKQFNSNINAKFEFYEATRHILYFELGILICATACGTIPEHILNKVSNLL